MFTLWPLLESLYHAWMLNFVKAFFYIYWNNHIVLFFSLLMWYIIVIDLRVLNYPWIPGITPTWSCFITLFMYCWIQVPNIFLRSSAPMFISYNFFLYLCIRVMLTSWNGFTSIPSSAIFWGEYFQKVSC